MIVASNILENLIKRCFLYIFLLIFVGGFLLWAGFFNTKGISNKIKSIFSGNLSGAVSSLSPVFKREEINFENLLPEEKLVSELSPAPAASNAAGADVPAAIERKEPEVILAEIQEELDDITEEIDIINQKITELGGESQEAQGEEKEKQEELVEKKLEEEEDVEEEKEPAESPMDNQAGKEKEEGVCPDGIDINTASKEELGKIAGVGPVIAQRIIEARPFSSIYDLTRVSGISEKTLENIIKQDCAYVEDDTGLGNPGFISVPGGGGGGASPPPAVTYPEILISEVKIAEKIGDKNVFVELYNPNEIEVDLTNWYIFRNDSSFITKTLLEGEKIPLKGYFLIIRNGAIWENQADVLFDDKTLNEDDKIALKNPNGEVIDEISWSQIPSGFSFGRKWDGQNYGDFEIQRPTPKAENSQPLLPQPILEVLPSNIEFNIIESDSGSQSEIFTVSNSGEGVLEWNSIIEYDSSATETRWLTIEPEFGMVSVDSPSDVLVFPNISDLTPGVYGAKIIITDSAAEGSPKEIEVTLTVKEKILEDIISPEVIFNLEPTQTSLSFMLSWTAVDPVGSATPSGLEAFYLQYSVIPPVPPGDAAVVQYQNQAGEWKNWPILGDLNNDQNVNFLDHTILANHWMEQGCVEPDWCDGADFSKDGQVNTFDLEIFKSHWLKKDTGEVVLGSQKTELNVLGKDGYTYSFQIQAEDKAGNLSEWQEATTTINLPKKVVINEIQIDSITGIGGVDDDWVELYNPYDIDVSLAGWSIQKHSADIIHEPCSINKSFYKKNFPDAAVIPAKGFFLVVSTKASDSLKLIADMTIGWSLTSNNTIYLVRNGDGIESGDDSDIIDKVGFGMACFPEGSPALNPPEEKSIERKEPGLDTDDNSQDFGINGTPTPTNSGNEG